MQLESEDNREDSDDPGESSAEFIDGEIIYVPAYSSVFHDTQRPFMLTTTINIHNVDMDYSIELTRLQYYNTNGDLVKD